MELRTIGYVLLLISQVSCIPVALLYDYNVREALQLPKEDEVSSAQIKLKVPVVFYGIPFDSIFVNSNGLLSFQTEIPNFFNVQFPLDYPIIAPFYSNVDIRGAGTVSYYETNNKALLKRATDNVKDAFSDQQNFQATSLFIVTWYGVGYFNKGSDKINTYQVVLITDGASTFVEFLYPENGIQWIQGTGDESGLPDARAQAGFISPDGKLFTLPGSGTEVVRKLEELSNINLSGQFIYRVDGDQVQEPDLNNDSKQSQGPPLSCAEVSTSTYCHIQAKCVDYEEGFCCKCRQKYYGNGRYCVKKDVPLRVNGKVSGKLNEEKFENLDLQSYIVMADGRAYTAISKIPESIGFSIQSLQILGGVIAYVFAKPVRDALNGYQLTGGIFNHTATINFLNTSDRVIIKQKYTGLDVFDQLKLETEIMGEIPIIPPDIKVDIDEYQEEYTLTAPGVLQMTGKRTLSYNLNGDVVKQLLHIEQVFLFEYCNYENHTLGETWKLRVGKNFIVYEAREQIIRFALSNKITPLGDVDPCDEGRTKCGSNSACVVEGDGYRCVCSPGYQQIYRDNEVVCADIDECQTGLHDCDVNAQCINQVGAFTCQCNPGFEGNGQECQNANSCAHVQCSENAECIEQNQVAQCRCLPGFAGDGQSCTPVQSHGCDQANNCHQYAACSYDRNLGSYYCSCLPGFDGDGYQCERIEPVETTTAQIVPLPGSVPQYCRLGECWCPAGYVINPGTNYCTADERATDDSTTTEVPSGYNGESFVELQCYDSTCFCPKGFNLNHYTNSCIPTSQLLTQGVSGFNVSCNILNNCHSNAQCVQDNDGWNCECKPGFVGDGYQCAPEEVSCAKVNNCDPQATCTYDDALGLSKCVCNAGFEGDGFTCRFIALCTSNSDCIETEECQYSTNTQRYECTCREGYSRDSQHQCVESATCGGAACVENAECLFDSQYEVRYCSCKTGYIGDGIVECKLKPTGCDILNNCGLHATCQYDQSTTLHQCKCEHGFYGDGFVCYTEINCHIEPALCHPQASCITDANRRYVCQCNQGYTGNGTHCRPNQKHEGNFLLLNQGMATLRIPLNNKKMQGKPIQLKYFQTAVGLDIDCFEGRVYWSDISGRAIRSSNYNGTDKTDFITQEIGSPEGLAIDWLSRNIYWTDSTKDRIEVASIDHKRRRVLFDSQLVNPRGIAVHPQRGKLFWTDWDRKNPKIEWANADGTGREIFLQGEAVSLPNSLTIDYDTEQLCYADAGTKKIECVQIDSRTRNTIAVNCTYPFGIATTSREIYWSDWISKQIERVDKSSLNRLPPLQVPLGGSGNKLFGLVAVPETCPQLANVCQYYKDQCPPEHICLPNGAGSRRCVCTYNADNPNETPTCTL